MSNAIFLDADVAVEAPGCTTTAEHIISTQRYDSTVVDVAEPSGSDEAPRLIARPATKSVTFQTERKVPKLGVMLVGWGGNNGTTVTAGVLANKHGMSWRTRRGEQKADWTGSVVMASTVRVGATAGGRDVYAPLRSLLPIADPAALEIGGWDISSMPLADAMERAAVLPVDLQRQLRPMMEKMGTPLPGAFDPAFVAPNQGARANHVLEGSKQAQLDAIREHIRAFKEERGVDRIVVLWTANTERFSVLEGPAREQGKALLEAIAAGGEAAAEVAPSVLYAVAAALEGCLFVNGSPQNTLLPSVVDLATSQGTHVGGDDFKSGQTKIKSVLVDFLVQAGMKPCSIASYNHLGNNDGYNLSHPPQFRSKEVSKSSVVDDVVASNGLLYDHARGEAPDHCVVIKYVPHVGDSKRAMDEYCSRIFLGGEHTLAIHNTCEDSLLAAPLIIDLVLLAEVLARVSVSGLDGEEGDVEDEVPATAAAGKGSPAACGATGAAARGGEEEAKDGEEAGSAIDGGAAHSPQRFHAVLSLLSYLLKAPAVPEGAPVVNALAAQRGALCNVLRAAAGLPAETHMRLEHLFRSSRESVGAAGSTVAAAAAAAAKKTTPGLSVSRLDELAARMDAARARSVAAGKEEAAEGVAAGRGLVGARSPAGGLKAISA